ncbi:MAG: phosphopantothenoylcysteine decarboxylase domain-containing protein [Planctomycetota bacterium]|jgi:phosphopantothenoylcysteine decarboxylase/phosphopantothenate--cysteine ligase
MHILVTAGPTREYFDTVRFISNPSTGKMGYAIAAEAARRGHEVDLVTGPVSIDAPPGVNAVQVVSAEEMLDASVAAFSNCDAAVMTAAVCDYRPAEKLDRKLKKADASREVLLLPTKDICAHLGSIKGGRLVVGFAMEDYDHRAHAEGKLLRKRCDAIVLNGLSNVAADAGSIEIFTADGDWRGPYAGTKSELAVVVVEMIEKACGRD